MTTSEKTKSIFLLHGENTFGIQEKIQIWKEGFQKKYGPESLIETIDGEKTTPKDFINSANTLPFLSDKKLLIIKNIFKNTNTEHLKNIAENLDNIADSTVLFFTEEKSADKRLTLYKTLKKIATVEEFPLLSEPEILNWIQSYTKKKHLQISRNDTLHLIETCGSNQFKIKNEIDKIHTYLNPKTDQTATINHEIINNLVAPTLSASIFRLTDAISTKNQPLALKTLHTVIDSGEDPFRIFYMLVRHFRLLLQVQDLSNTTPNSADIAKTLNLHPFVAKKLLDQKKSFSFEKIKRLYSEFLKTELQAKTGIIRVSADNNSQFSLALEKIILAIFKESPQ